MPKPIDAIINCTMCTQTRKRDGRTRDGGIRTLSFSRCITYRDKEIPPFQLWGSLKPEYEGQRHYFHYEAFVTYWRSLELKYPQRRRDDFYGCDEDLEHSMRMRFVEALMFTSDEAISGDVEKGAIKKWQKGIANLKEMRKGIRDVSVERVTMEDGAASSERWEMVKSKVNKAIRDAIM